MIHLSVLQISIGNTYLVKTQVQTPALDIGTEFAKDIIVGRDVHEY